MEIPTSTIHDCFKKVFDMDTQHINPSTLKKMIKMYLAPEFHPLFILSTNVTDRLARFFAKQKNPSIMKYIEESKNDVCLLQQLHRMLYVESKTDNKGREDSRIADIFMDLKPIRERQKHVKNFTYLDLGCSEGKITKSMVSTLRLTPAQSFACDIFPQEDEKEYQFSQSGQTNLPYHDQQFDFITLFMSAHHFSDMDKMLLEIKRVLKPGGYVLLREHHCRQPKDAIFYNIVHAIWACVYKKEMTPYEFVKAFVKQEKTHYYAKYRSIKEWTDLFTSYSFIPIGSPHFSAFYDSNKRRWTYKEDQMNAAYLLFQK